MASIFRDHATPIALARTSDKLLKMLGITVLAMAAMALTASHARAADKLAPQDRSFLKSATEDGNAEVSSQSACAEKQQRS